MVAQLHAPRTQQNKYLLGGRLQGRRQQEGQWRPASPFKICAPRLLHTPNILFKICGPSLRFLPPLLRHPGDGPGRLAA